MRGFDGRVRLLDLGAGSLGLRGSEDAERNHGSKELSWEAFIHTERAWLGDLLLAWDGEGPRLFGRIGDGALGTLLGSTGDETWRRDTSPRFGEPTRFGFVVLQGDAGLFEPRTLLPYTRELFGDMLFFLVYLAGIPRDKGSLCSWSGEGGRGGVKRLGLRLCWGEVGGESGRGY